MTERTKQAFIAPSIFDGVILHSQCALLIEHHTIVAIVPQDQIPQEYSIQNFPGMLAPGFIDLQVNGGGGILFNDAPNLIGLQKILSAHLSMGTHALLPTLITANDAIIESALSALSYGVEKKTAGLLGIHIEGPMINPKRKGIHHEPNIRTLSETIIDQICAEDHFVRLVTLAPECVELSLIERLTQHGVIVFAGHTKASPDRLKEAISAGLKGFTHLFNAMPQMESRNPKTTGFALQDQTSYASIIHDQFHVDPFMVKLAYQSKPKGKLFLVSDAMSTVGSQNQQFLLDGQPIFVKEGRLVNSEGTLAGAHIDMAQSVLNSTKNLNISLIEAIKLGTTYPAELIQNPRQTIPRYGLLKKGFQAAINHYHDNRFEPIIL